MQDLGDGMVNLEKAWVRRGNVGVAEFESYRVVRWNESACEGVEQRE